MKKTRITYAILFCILLLTEVLIGLFVHDAFIRPFVGDVLITVLLCCLIKVIAPKLTIAVPVCVFMFATAVEFLQYLDFVKLIGLDQIRFFSIIMGRTFSVMDIVCYAVGCVLFFIVDYTVLKHLSKAKRQD